SYMRAAAASGTFRHSRTFVLSEGARMAVRGSLIASLWIAAVLLCGCGGQNGLTRAVPEGFRAPAGVRHASGSESGLVYVVTSGVTDMLEYPGYGSAGTLNPAGFLGYPCSDSSDGNVFLDTGSEVRRYRFGESDPVYTLFLKPGDFGKGCAVDPTTTNLALTGTHNAVGAVLVYPKGKGHPKRFTSAKIREFFYGGYDAECDLFVDGITKADNAFALYELAKGA